MAQPVPPQDFLNETTIGTLTGAAMGIWAFSAVFRKVFRINHPGVPLIMSLAISFVLAYTKETLSTPIGWLITLLNSAILFCAVVGGNETVTDLATKKPAGQPEQQGAEPMPWLKSFFD